MVEKFNEYFINIGPTLASNIQDIAGDHLSFIANRPTDSMFIKRTYKQEIKGIVRDLLPNKSPGHYDILSRAVTAVIDHLSAPLCEICNKSFQTRVFPDKLKLATVIPVFKSENKALITNYQPISVLFNGFREKRSTYMALLQLIDKVTHELEIRRYAIFCGILQDLSKAFNTINHNILIDKLECYGLRDISLQSIKSNLNN